MSDVQPLPGFGGIAPVSVVYAGHLQSGRFVFGADIDADHVFAVAKRCKARVAADGATYCRGDHQGSRSISWQPDPHTELQWRKAFRIEQALLVGAHGDAL